MTALHPVGIPHAGDLAGRLTGTLVLPGDTGWDAARRPWNLAIDQRPAAVVFAESVADVRRVVSHAREHGMQVAPQATGHLAATLTDLSRTILLRTERLATTVVDGDAVRVGAGVTWRSLVEALRPHGRTGLYGTSDGVGVVGYTIGGGIGWLARKHGPASATIRAARVVDGTGAAFDADGDLLWALAGGGGGFCVVTELTFETQPITDVYAGALWFPVERAAQVIATYHEWTADLTDDATTAVRIMRVPNAPTPFVIVQGSILGPDAARTLAPLRALSPAKDTFHATTTDAMSAVHLAPADPSPTAGDGFVVTDLPDSAQRIVLDHAGAGIETPLAVVEFRHLGGKLGRSSAGAFGRLGGRYLVKTGNVAPDRTSFERVLAAGTALERALAPWAAPRHYLNFRESAVAPATLFAGGTRNRLRGIKTRHDPEDVIRGSQTPWR